MAYGGHGSELLVQSSRNLSCALFHSLRQAIAEASERVTDRRHSQRATHDFLPNVLRTPCVCAQAPVKVGWTAESGRNTVGKQNLAGLAESGRISRIWPDGILQPDDPPWNNHHYTDVTSRLIAARIQVVHAAQRSMGVGAHATAGPGPHTPGDTAPNLTVSCERGQLERVWEEKTKLTKPKLALQGSDQLVKRQFKLCAKTRSVSSP